MLRALLFVEPAMGRPRLRPSFGRLPACYALCRGHVGRVFRFSSSRVWELVVMPQGTVKKLVSDRGFGFIAADREDVFFHHSSMVGTAFDDLREGQLVEYELGQERGKVRATQVKVV